MSTEAMKLALKALDRHQSIVGLTNNKQDVEAIIALQEALAQPQQEPVAWMWRCKPYCNWPEWSVSLQRPADSGCDGNKRTEGYEDIPLYAAPPARKPLTKQQRNDIYNKCRGLDVMTAILLTEAAHNIKENT